MQQVRRLSQRPVSKPLCSYGRGSSHLDLSNHARNNHANTKFRHLAYTTKYLLCRYKSVDTLEACRKMHQATMSSQSLVTLHARRNIYYAATKVSTLWKHAEKLPDKSMPPQSLVTLHTRRNIYYAATIISTLCTLDEISSTLLQKPRHFARTAKYLLCRYNSFDTLHARRNSYYAAAQLP